MGATKKDYTAIAQIVKKQLHDLEQFVTSTTPREIINQTLSVVVYDIANYFQQENKGFDRESFLQNCGVLEGKEPIEQSILRGQADPKFMMECFTRAMERNAEPPYTRTGCMQGMCTCHVDPHAEGFFCSGCGCTVIRTEISEIIIGHEENTNHGPTHTRTDCMKAVCDCHLDPHLTGFSCPVCGCTVVCDETPTTIIFLRKG